MNTSEIAEAAQRIRRVFVLSLSLDLNPDEASIPADLASVAALDSLAILQFVAGLEQEFGREIDPDRLNIEFLSDLNALAEYFAGCSSTLN